MIYNLVIRAQLCDHLEHALQLPMYMQEECTRISWIFRITVYKSQYIHCVHHVHCTVFILYKYKWVHCISLYNVCFHVHNILHFKCCSNVSQLLTRATHTAQKYHNNKCLYILYNVYTAYTMCIVQCVYCKSKILYNKCTLYNIEQWVYCISLYMQEECSEIL